MSAVEGLQSSDITKVGIGVIIALVVIGFLLTMALNAIVARVVIVVVVSGLALLVWQQRSAVEDRIKKCQLDTSFVGVHVQAPADVVTRCHQLNR